MSLKQISSLTTIKQQAKSLRPSTEPTDTGVQITLSGEQTQAGLDRMQQVNNPAKVDKLLLTSLECTTGCKVVEISRSSFKDDGVDIIVSGYRIESTSLDAINKCIATVMQAMVPMPKEMLVDDLTLLAALVVKPAGESSDDHAMRIQAIANELSAYPADIVKYAIKQVSETTTFWPSYSEFHKHIKWRLRRRELMLSSLQQKKLDLTA